MGDCINETEKRQVFQDFCVANFLNCLTSHTVSRSYLNAVKLHILGCNPQAVQSFCNNSSKKTAKFKFKVKERNFTLLKKNGVDTVVVPRDRKDFIKKENTAIITEEELVPVACVEDFFDIIKAAHNEVGHQGSRSTYRMVQQKYACIPRKAVLRFIEMCEVCRLIEPSTSDSVKRYSSPIRRTNAKKMNLGSLGDLTTKTGSLKGSAVSKITELQDKLSSISHQIWSTPELDYKEHFAHDILCKFLEDEGFEVERGFCSIDTAFAAGFAIVCPLNETGNECNVALLCEYDALPELGHACGHNLIAEIGVGAAAGVKAAMMQAADAFPWPYSRVQVTVIGCPAEEGGGGKIKLLEAGAFNQVDVALMAHPAPVDVAMPKLPAIKCLEVDYHGRASHACIAPWEGINALDAAVQAYTSLSSLRQQLPPDTRLACIITKGGVDAGVIPDNASLKVSYRAVGEANMERLGQQVEGCLMAAATSSRCKVRINVAVDSYQDVVHNSVLASLYLTNHELLGASHEAVEEDTTRTGLIFSTDFGDVSKKVAGLHPVYSIGTHAPNHTIAFAAAAGDEAAQEPTLEQAKALAWTVLDLFTDSQKLELVKAEFNSNSSCTKVEPGS